MPDRRIGLLYIAPWLTIGGSDRNTIDTLRCLDPRRFRVMLITTQEASNPLFADAARYAAEAWSLPDLMPGARMPRFVAEVIDRHRVDVLHVMNSRLGFDLVPALRRSYAHLRVVAQLHAEEHPAGTGYPRYVAARLGGAIDAYSVISRHLRDRLVAYGVDAERIHVIGLGVDAELFDPETTEPREIGRRDGEFHVLFPARLTWQKDPLQVVEIARVLRDRGSSAVIHMVGDGDLRQDVQRRVDQFDLGARVLLHGSDVNMPAWYAATDATLLPSRYEGIPLAIYESMAMAKPVVVADVGGIAELVDDSMGFLIRNRDDPVEFAEALRRLEGDAEQRARMGRSARERARREFPVARVATEHARLYEDLAQSAPPRGHTPALDGFDDWWADGTSALLLGVSVERRAAALYRENDPPFAVDAHVRVGRILDLPLPGTTPLVAKDGQPLGHAFTAPLPGMIELTHVLPGHLKGLWKSVSDAPRPPLPLASGAALWVDAPYLVPESTPRSPAPYHRGLRPRWRR